MDNKTVKQLREIAKEIGLRGFWKLRKADLIDLIEQSERALRRVEGALFSMNRYLRMSFREDRLF